ncbi:MAG TPA: AMP-binding protein [Acidimicrobiales bacterium]|nr:AMP-binding protein [Acidimicrobiales bacterium]
MTNVAALHELIAGAVGDRACIVQADRRLSWAEVTDRTRRLAAVLGDAGLGVHGDPLDVEPWESPHDHVALYLYNGNEYLEGMLGAWKARCAAVNVNYRYVATELAYVLRDSRAGAIVVGGTFVETLAEVLPDLPDLRLVLQVDDGSGAPLLPGAVDYEAALAVATPVAPVGLSPADRYILYTGGTTGMPKGVLWRQDDFLVGALGISGPADEIVAAAARRVALATLPSAPFMHGAAHWNALSSLLAGGTIVLPADPSRVDPADILATIEREQVSSLQIVGDAFARPLLAELARQQARGDGHGPDLSSLRYVVSGGAVLSRPVKDQLVAAVPGLRIVDVLGASETGRQAVGSRSTGGFQPSEGTAILSEDRSRVLAPGDDELGWLAQKGHVPLGYLGDPDKTRATFPTVDGARYAVPGDRVRWSPDGTVEFFGRDSVTINTGGEKVFAEEVEQALTSHPAVEDALVVGRPDPRWGQAVVAVLSLREGVAAPPGDDDLRDHCRRTIAAYKVPKAFFWSPTVERSPSGKPDYAWARTVVTA